MISGAFLVVGLLSCRSEAPPVPPFAPPPMSAVTFRSLLVSGEDIGARVGFPVLEDRLSFYEVTPGGPAYVAGFRTEDQVFAVDGRSWASKAEAEAILRSVVPNVDVLRVDVERWGRTETLLIRLDDPVDRPQWVDALQRATPGAECSFRWAFDEETQRNGVEVLTVEPGGGCAVAGLRTGDFLFDPEGPAMVDVVVLRGGRRVLVPVRLW